MRRPRGGSRSSKDEWSRSGLPSGMMRRRMDITASDPSVEFVERRTSAGWNDGAREYGALADYERGFGQGARFC